MSELHPKGDNQPEFDTMPRHSLAYSLIGTEDRFIRHPSGMLLNGQPSSSAIRVVEYESRSIKQANLREALINQGLILGSVLTEQDEEYQAFRVPRSARPLLYETKVNDGGSYSYGDSQLFYDVGRLTKQLYEINDEHDVLAGDIGRLIALVEFTKPNEPTLYFVPGVEKGVASLQESLDPRQYYLGRLQYEFRNRFAGHEQDFIDGFGGEAA